MTRRLLIRLLAGLLVGAVAGAAYAIWGPRPGGSVGLPAASAAPEEVAAAFIDALDQGDCDAAEAMSTPDFAETARSWCGRVASLDDAEIGEARTEDAAASGHPAATEVVSVPVRFGLDLRLFRGDASLREGATTWGYRLVRAGDGPWRVADHGHG